MAGEKEVGRVSIRVVADIEKFRPKVEKEAQTLDDVEVRIKPDFDKKELEKDVKEAEKSTKGKVSFDTELDTYGLKEKMRMATQALRDSVTVAAKLDTGGLAARLKAFTESMRTSVPVEVTADAKKFLAEVQAVKEATRRHLSNIKIGFKQLTLVKDVTRAAMGARRAAEFVLKDIPLSISQSSVGREVAKLRARFIDPIKARLELSGERLSGQIRAAKARAKSAWGRLTVALSTQLDKVSVAKTKAYAKRALGNLRFNVDVLQAGVLNDLAALRARAGAILGKVRMKVSLSDSSAAKSAKKGKTIAELILSDIKARVSVATRPFVSKLQALKGLAERALKDIPVSVTLSKAAGAIAGKVRALRNRIERAARARVNFEPVTAPFMKAVAGAKARAERALGKIEAKLGIKERGFVSKCRVLAKMASTALRVKAKVTVDKKKFIRDLAVLNSVAKGFVRPFGKLFGGKIFVEFAKNITAIKGAMAVATVAVGSLMVSMSALGGATWSALKSFVLLGAALAPSALAAVGLGIGSMIKSFSGFFSVLKAKDLNDLSEAMAGMGPNARRGAQGIYAIKDAFNKASAGTQEAFWGALSQDLAALAPIGRMVGASLEDIARYSGEAANGFARFLASGRGMAIMDNLISNSANVTKSLAGWFFNVLPGITAVGSAASEILADMLKSISASAQEWSDRMVAGFQDGSLLQRLQEMREEVSRFGSALGDIGHVVGAVFKAAADAGQGALDTMSENLGKAVEWVDSIEGQQALMDFFDAMSRVASTMGPMMFEVATVITGTVAPAIADFIEAIGPGATDLLHGFADALERLAPLAGPLGSALGTVMSAIGPMLPVLAPLIPVVAALAGAFMGFQRVMPIIGALSGVLGALSAPVLAVVGVLGFFALAVSQVEGASSQVKEAFSGVGQAIQPIIEAVKQFGQGVMESLRPAFEAAAPVVAQFVEAIGQIITALSPIIGTILQVAGAVIGALVPVFVAIMPIISSVISVVVSLVQAFAPVLNVVLQVAGAFVTLLAHIVGFAASALAVIVGWVASGIAAFVGFVGTGIALIAGWASGILAKVGELVNGFLAKCSELWAQTVAKFSEGVTNALRYVQEMPGRAKAALGNVGSLLVSSGAAMIAGFIRGIVSKIGEVRAAASKVVQAAKDFFPHSPAKRGPLSGKGYTTYSGAAMIDGFIEGIASRTRDLQSTVSSVVSDARAPFDQLNKNKILQPVLESNAKKIHDARKKEKDAHEKHLEKLAKIDKNYVEKLGKKGSAAKKLEAKNKSIAKENERYAKQIADIRDKLNKSIEAPDYSKMDLSINKYFVEGAKELLQNQLLNDYRAVSGQFKSMVNQAVSFARSRVGDHPILGQIAWNVNSKEFDFAVEKLIKDAGIAEVPIEFVATNLDKLKSDLGMGSGVISKSIDAAMAFDRNKNDFNSMVHGTKEIHYHVEDMDEAIRLEQLRERKQLMGMF